MSKRKIDLKRREKGKGLAGLKVLWIRLGSGRGRNRNNNNNKKKKKVRIKMVQDMWHKLVFPVRRVWFAVSARVKARKNGVGLLKLHDDIQTCGYEDVQVMWEMLRRTESELMPRDRHVKRKRPFSRIFIWFNNGSSSSLLSNHHHHAR